MPWYSAGTVTVTNNSPTVTGAGTTFSANARVGDAFRGPDGFWYEVTNVASATVISIKPNYQGATNSAGAYAIAPMQGYVKDSADALRAFVNQYGAQLAGLGPLASWQSGQSLALSGNGVRIVGEMSSGAGSFANRLFFQSSTPNGQTSISAMPNGAGSISALQLWSSADLENSSRGNITIIGGNQFNISSARSGFGAHLPMTFTTGDIERIRISTGGDTTFGSAEIDPIGNRVTTRRFTFNGMSYVFSNNAGCPSNIGVSNTSHPLMTLYYNATGLVGVGSITTNGTSTSYNTSSDYRLKEDVTPLDPVSATERIMAYRPVTWTWKSDGSFGKGFIAHENQAVDPSTATGKKDEMRRVGNIRLPDYTLVAEMVPEPDDLLPYGEGAKWEFIEEQPVYQGRDDSMMIPDMIAVMQRQELRIRDLEEQLQQVLTLLLTA